MEEKITELEKRVATLEEQVQPIDKEVFINSLVKSLDASFSQLIENLKSANYGTCEEYTIRLVRDEIGIPVGTAQEVPVQEQNPIILLIDGEILARTIINK